MNFWLIWFDNTTFKEWHFDDLNENIDFEFFTYICAVATIRACFDQNIFIVTDDYTIGLIDVLQNIENILHYGYDILISWYFNLKRYDRWASL
jgi:hypothetical protein